MTLHGSTGTIKIRLTRLDDETLERFLENLANNAEIDDCWFDDSHPWLLIVRPDRALIENENSSLHEVNGDVSVDCTIRQLVSEALAAVYFVYSNNGLGSLDINLDPVIDDTEIGFESEEGDLRFVALTANGDHIIDEQPLFHS